MYDDGFDDGQNAPFRKQKGRRGIKGYWLLLILALVVTGTLYGGVAFRQALPPLPFLVKEPPPPDPPAPVSSSGIDLS